MAVLEGLNSQFKLGWGFGAAPKPEKVACGGRGCGCGGCGARIAGVSVSDTEFRSTMFRVFFFFSVSFKKNTERESLKMKAKTKTTAYWNQKGIAELVRMVIGDFCECVCVCVWEEGAESGYDLWNSGILWLWKEWYTRFLFFTFT